MFEPVLSGKELSDVIAASWAVEGANMLPYTLSRAVERAVLTKLAEEQEPVGYFHPMKVDMLGRVVEWSQVLDKKKTPLYTHPIPAQPVDKAAVQAVLETINRTMDSRGTWQEIERAVRKLAGGGT